MSENYFCSKPFSAYRTDSSFLRKVQSGSETAWNEFYEKYSSLIHFIGQKRRLTQEECRELTVDVMTIFWKKMDQFVYDRSRGRFRSYLGKIAHNSALLIFSRREKQPPPLPPEDYPDELDKAIMEEWRDYLLSQALEDLKEKVDTETFQVFYMSFVQKCSVQEIAAVTRRTPSNIYVIRYRCLAHLRTLIASYRKFDEEFSERHSHKKPEAN